MGVTNGTAVLTQINNQGGVLEGVAIGVGNTVINGAGQPSQPWIFDGRNNRSVNAGSIGEYSVITTGDANNIVGFSRSGERDGAAPVSQPATPQASVATTPVRQSTQSAPAATPAPEQGNANGAWGRVGAVVQGAGQAFSYMAKGTFENVGKAAGAFAKGYQQTFGQQGSMGQTQVPASQARTQPAATDQQQASYSNRQTTAPVAGKGSVADGLAKVAALSAIGTTMAVGFAAAAPLVLAAAPAVAMAYMAIKAAEALMNFFKGVKQQGQPAATSQQQQQQQQPAGQQAGQPLHGFNWNANQQQGQAQVQAPAAQSTAQASAQGEQQPTDQQLAIPGLESTSNANGASTGIQFTQDVDLGSMKAPAPGFNLDAVMGALSARGRE